MTSRRNWREAFHPRLADALERCGDSAAICVDDLDAGDVLELRTKNHTYRAEVLDPEKRLVRVTSDGPHVTEPTDMVVAGALLVPHGSMIMVGRVALGHCLEFARPDRGRLVVTPLRRIAVNGVTVFPRDDDDFSMVN